MELPGNCFQPCGEIVATVVEIPSARPTAATSADAIIGPKPGDRRQPTGLFVLLRPANELSVKKRCDPSIELRPLRAGVLDEQGGPCVTTQSRLRSRSSISNGQELLRASAYALRRDHSLLQQKWRATLIDQSCPLTHQTGLAIDEASACQAGPGSSVRQSASSAGSPPPAIPSASRSSFFCAFDVGVGHIQETSTGSSWPWLAARHGRG